MTTLIVDIETDDLLHKLSRIWLICIKDKDTGELISYVDRPGYPSISEAAERIRKADLIIGHNFLGFDIHAINRFYPGTVDRKKVIDTLALARLFDPEADDGHSLEVWGKRLGKHKGDFKDFSKFSKEMDEYCRNDVEVCSLIYDKLKQNIDAWDQRCIRLELDVFYIIGLQMMNGFGFDVPKAQSLLADLMQEQANVEVELQKAFPPFIKKWEETIIPKRDNKARGYKAGVPFVKQKSETVVFNPGSRQMIADRLIEKYEWKPKVFTPTGQPQIDESILKNLDFSEAALLAKYLKLDKMIGMLDAPIKKDGSGGGWLKHERNGRIYGYVNSNGAVTGRMTHSKPNVAQADKDKRMRSLYIPRPGWKLVGCDAEGLELRMLGHYLAAWDKGEYAKAVVEGKKDDETDVHSKTRKSVGLWLRDSAKTLIYAIIYGAGDSKVGSIVVEDSQKAEKKRPEGTFISLGKGIKKRIERGIKGFKNLKDAVYKKAQSAGFLKGLDGRKIYVRSTHSALNTLLQGGGACVMKVALVHFHEKHESECGIYFNYCANVHDEVQLESVEDRAEHYGKSFADSIVEAGKILELRCPMAGKYDIGDNWSQTH